MIDHDLNNFIEQMLTKHYKTVVRCAYMRLGNIHDAEDAAQDVFVALMTAKKRPLTEEHAKAWLIRSVINRSVDILRSRRYRDTVELNEELDGEYTACDGGLGDTAAIDAVMNPSKDDEVESALYFVADSNGKVYFNDTNDGHEKTIKELKSQGLWYEY